MVTSGSKNKMATAKIQTGGFKMSEQKQMGDDEHYLYHLYLYIIYMSVVAFSLFGARMDDVWKMGLWWAIAKLAANARAS